MNYEQNFGGRHRWDDSFFLFLVALIWLGILMGFIPKIIEHTTGIKPPFPLIVYVHGVIFAGWLCFLTLQILLVRFGRTDLHRTLGIAGAMLAGAMIAFGPVTAIISDELHRKMKDSDPSFLAIQWGDILIFAGLVTAALLLREKSAAHKRLILLATIFISHAGFSRWLGQDFKFAGNGFVGEYLQTYVFDFVLVVFFAAYDFFTRRKLHPAFVVGAAWGLSLQLVIIWLYVSPWWKPVALTIIGR